MVDISTERDNKIDGLSPLNDATEECELFLTPEEDKMVTLISFYEIEPYIKGLKADERINGYGKYSTMPENGSIYLFIYNNCLLYTSPSPRDKRQSRMPSSA